MSHKTDARHANNDELIMRQSLAGHSSWARRNAGERARLRVGSINRRQWQLAKIPVTETCSATGRWFQTGRHTGKSSLSV